MGRTARCTSCGAPVEFKSVASILAVCNYSQDNRAAAETAYTSLAAAFQPGRIVRRDVARGSVDAV